MDDSSDNDSIVSDSSISHPKKKIVLKRTPSSHTRTVALSESDNDNDSDDNSTVNTMNSTQTPQQHNKHSSSIAKRIGSTRKTKDAAKQKLQQQLDDVVEDYNDTDSDSNSAGDSDNNDSESEQKQEQEAASEQDSESENIPVKANQNKTNNSKQQSLVTDKQLPTLPNVTKKSTIAATTTSRTKKN